MSEWGKWHREKDSQLRGMRNAISHRVIREGLIRRVIVEQRSEGVSQANIRRGVF